MARLVHDRKFTPHVYWLGMHEQIVSLIWNVKLKATMKPETVAAVDRIEHDIREGKFDVPRGKF
jgi:basic membrane lipoprotein Med (substrate-binding protein (PBP1-ABC) superfamily)